MGLTSTQVSGTCSFDWPQQIGDGAFDPTAAQTEIKQQQREPPLRCPRCDSSNTKFCYYNNYSHTQPRHFCRACRRHWTQGGTLRTVPVGGCPRKNKRQKLTPPESSIGTVQPEADLYAGNGVLNSSVFTDIFRQVLIYPTPEHGGINSNFAFQSEYQTVAPVAAASKDEGVVINPSPIAASSSYSNGSTLDSAAGDTTLLSLMPGSGSSGAWIQDPSPLPDNYFWWNDTLADFIAPPPAAAQPPVYPWTNE